MEQDIVHESGKIINLHDTTYQLKKDDHSILQEQTIMISRFSIGSLKPMLGKKTIGSIKPTHTHTHLYSYRVDG